MLNISRSKDNQTMRFGQLIQYNIRNIFLKKIHKKCRNLWNSSVIFYTVFLICKVEVYRSTLKISCRPIVFTTNEDFLKNKKNSRPSFNATFSALFLKKNISLVIFYYLTKLHCLAAFSSWDIVQYAYCNCLLTRLRLH